MSLTVQFLNKVAVQNYLSKNVQVITQFKKKCNNTKINKKKVKNQYSIHHP